MNNKRALVVDDSKVGRLTMKKKLEAHGVVVDLAESAKQALDYLVQNQHRPDMIFMDHMMPGMDGFEATQRIKAAPATRDIPIIIISGRDDEDYVEEARSIGANHAICKPPAPGVLESILSSIPEMVARQASGGVGEAAAQQVFVERRAAPYMDQAAVHALVERMLGEFVEHLHSDNLAELRAQLEAELENERKALRERSEQWREQLDQTKAGIVDLQRSAMEAETLRQQLNAIEQRLLPLESDVARAEPDPDSMLEKVEQHVASRLAELQARTERQEPMVESLRQELLVRTGEQQAQVEQSIGELAGRLDGLSEAMKQLSEGTLSSAAGHDERYAAIEQRLAAIEGIEHTPGPDLEPILAAMDGRIEPRLAEMRNELQTQLQDRSTAPLEEALRESLSGQLQEQHEALRAELEAQRTQVQAVEKMRDALEAELATQGERLQAQVEQSVGELAGRLDRLSEELEQLSGGTLSSAAVEDERYAAIEQRLTAIESIEHTPGPGLETILAAMDGRIEPRLAEMRNELQTQLQDRSTAPLEEALRESLSGQLQEQHEALRAELEAQRTQVQAVEQIRDVLEAELAAQGERLQTQIDQEHEQLMGRYEQEKAQLATSLEQQQARLGACDDGWTSRFQALEERFEEMAQVGIDDGVQRVLEQRIAQMREVVGAALQPSYPGRGAWAAEAPHEVAIIDHEAPLVRAPATDEGGGLLRVIEAEISDLREQLSESQLRRLIADAVGSARPAAGADSDIEEPVALRLADGWNDRLRAEVAKFENKLKTLTVIIAVGGMALVAAIATVALLR